MDLPDPPRSGNHLRDLQNLAVLDLLGYDTHVVAARATPGDRGVGPNAELGAVVELAPPRLTALARAERLARIVRGGAGGRPGPWALAYEDAGIGEQVDTLLRAVKPEVLVLRSVLAHLGPSARGLVDCLIFDVHDAEVLQARSLLSTQSWPQRVGGVARWIAARRLDRSLAIGDELWVPSPRERDYYAGIVPGLRVVVVPNGVGVPALPAWEPRQPELLLVAGFGYPPNVAAARRLVERVLPLVLESLPEARVTLVGRDLSSALEHRWSNDRVSWLGVVDNLATVYGRPVIAVLPYDPSTETGTPLKVAEAISLGVPVVATPNATAALGLVYGEHVLGGYSDDELAAGIVTLVREPDFARAMVERAHRFASDNLSPAAIAARLAQRSLLCHATPIGS
jgi:glycosyltransferase involved in cell wall biosynthesis